MRTEEISLAPLLDWLPDESLFSLCSRFHLLSGYATSDRTCTTLFNNRRSSANHDIPNQVGHVSRVFGGHLGSANEIVLQHSLLPFYFPYHPKDRCQNWLDQLSLGSASSVKSQLGLAASRFGAAHPLKACPSCMTEDLCKFGTTYWHVVHQLPGVLVCPAHQCPMLAASDKVTGINRFSWVLPFQARLEPLLLLHEIGSLEIQWSKLSIALWNQSVEFEFSIAKLKQLYRQKMAELDLFDNNTLRVNSSKFAHLLDSMLRESGVASIWPWLLTTQNAAILTRRLLRFIGVSGGDRDSRHPLNHALLQVLLFGSWAEFWIKYEHSDFGANSFLLDSHSPKSTLKPIPKTNQTQQRQSVLEALNRGHSITRAAKVNEIAVNTAKTWASQAGIATAIRPKVLKPSLRNLLISNLARGMDKTQAATEVGMSVVTVTRVLLTEPGLHDHWLNSRRAKVQSHSRSVWTAAINALPAASSNTWRALDPAAYAWLYRNDRVWLQASIRERNRPVPQPQFRRDWGQRDDVLAQAVLTAALELVKRNDRKRLTLGELCSSVKGLRAVQSALNKMPRTAAAIQQVCSASSRPAVKPQLSLDGSLFDS